MELLSGGCALESFVWLANRAQHQCRGREPRSLRETGSGGFESEVFGNYNTLGWLFLTNDNDWLVTGNLGNETNDFYSIAHHEIGHALIFNEAHPGFAAAKTNGAFRSAGVTNYDPTNLLAPVQRSMAWLTESLPYRVSGDRLKLGGVYFARYTRRP